MTLMFDVKVCIHKMGQRSIEEKKENHEKKW